MKKFMALTLALTIVSAALPVGAAKPAGLKDVEQTATAESVTASIPALNERKIIESRNFDVNVTMANVGAESKSYAIYVYSDEKIISSETAVVEANSTIAKSVKVKDCKQGPQTLKVEVKAEGKNILTQDYEVNVIVPYKSQFMDWASGHGLCGYKTEYYWNLVGWNSIRTSYEWNSIERTEGVYDFSGWLQATKPFMKDSTKLVYLVTYNNPLYNGRTDTMARQYGPKTKREFDAYAKYAAKAAEENPNIKYFELYNEPNIGFWKPSPNVDDYTYLCEIAAREIKKVRPDAVVTVGAMAGANAAWPKNMYARNAFSSMDSISYHPYVYPAKADVSAQTSIDGIHDLILTNGGWKEGIITEMGWPTHEGGTGITGEQQSIEFVKAYIMSDANGVDVSNMYRENDPGRNKSYNEDNFGMVYYEGNPKETISSVKELNQRTNGAIYMGEIELPNDMVAHMYLRDQKLEVAAWNKAGGENESDVYDFGTKLTAYDRYGNNIGSDTKIELGESPVWLEGFSTDTIAQNVYYNVKKSLDHSREQFAELEDNKGFKDVMNMLYAELENFKFDVMPSAEKAEEFMQNYYAIGDKMIEMYKSGELEGDIKDITGMLYMVYLSGKPVMNMYLASVNSDESYILQNTDKVKAARKEITELADDGTLSYAEAVVKYAEETAEDATVLLKSADKSRMKCGILKAWDALSGIVADWAVEVAAVEEKEYNDILMQIPSSEAVIETNIPKIFNISFYNYSPKTISGVVELVSPSGNVVGTSEEATLESGESMSLPLEALIENLEDSDKDYMLRFVQDGRVLKESRAPIQLKVSLDVQMTLVETKFDDINTISVDLENLTSEMINAVVEIKAPEGWKLSADSQKVVLAGNETNKVSFGVVNKVAVPYHFYAFEVTVKNEADKIIYNNKLPLTFTQIVKAEREYSTANFDGDISDWADAYPIYLGIPEDVTSYEDWQEADVAARVLTKWDEKYLYLLVDVFDNSHINGKVSGQIWDGDCVQVSIDPNNDKDDKKYQTEDYEYGFAYTDMNGNTSYSWYTNPSSHTAGDEPGDYSVMLRDNTTKLSRYLIRLPQSAVTPLTLREGSVFGYNVAINDADFTARERLIEYVPGTAAAKRPSIYPDYVLIGKEETPTGKSICPIPSGMKVSENDEQKTEQSFKDIKGHWAEDMIETFSKRGYVSGIGDNLFAPDKTVSRAEFITMMTNFAGITTKENKQISMFAENEETKVLAPKSYFDVERDAWYAQNVYDAKQAGIISGFVANAYFYPEREITREEVCTIIDSYLANNGDTSVSIKAINEFLDSSEVSDGALKSVMNLYGLGILKGNGSGEINPKSALTRAEAVAFLTAVMNMK